MALGDWYFKINGQVMSEVTDNDSDTRRRIGLIAFQLHKGPAMKVQFRNIRLIAEAGGKGDSE